MHSRICRNQPEIYMYTHTLGMEGDGNNESINILSNEINFKYNVTMRQEVSRHCLSSPILPLLHHRLLVHRPQQHSSCSVSAVMMMMMMMMPPTPPPRVHVMHARPPPAAPRASHRGASPHQPHAPSQPSQRCSDNTPQPCPQPRHYTRPPRPTNLPRDEQPPPRPVAHDDRCFLATNT